MRPVHIKSCLRLWLMRWAIKTCRHWSVNFRPNTNDLPRRLSTRPRNQAPQLICGWLKRSIPDDRFRKQHHSLSNVLVKPTVGTLQRVACFVTSFLMNAYWASFQLRKKINRIINRGSFEPVPIHDSPTFYFVSIWAAVVHVSLITHSTYALLCTCRCMEISLSPVLMLNLQYFKSKPVLREFLPMHYMVPCPEWLCLRYLD